MNTELRIAQLNKRMAEYYLPKDNDTNVIAVCLFVSSDGRPPFIQGWFSRFDENGHRHSQVDIEDFIAEGNNINSVLLDLEEYVNTMDELYNEEQFHLKKYLLDDAEKIIEETGFGD